jgi:hypothetical protein
MMDCLKKLLLKASRKRDGQMSKRNDMSSRVLEYHDLLGLHSESGKTIGLIPSLATLAITWDCPCSCERCGLFHFREKNDKLRQKSDRVRREELSTEDLCRVIDETVSLGVTNIALSGGEPLLRQDLVTLINHVPSEKANVLLFTNGALLTDKKVKELAATDLYGIVISIDSSKPEVHDSGRKLKGLFDKAVEGASRALKAGIPTGFSTTVTEADIMSGELEKRISFAKDLAVTELIIYDTVPEKAASASAIAELKRLQEVFFALPGNFKVTIPSLMTNGEGSGCFGGSHRFHMTPDGDICPCEYVPLSFGNVKKDSISAIWEAMISLPAYCNHPTSCLMKGGNFRDRYINTIPGDATMPRFIGQPEKVGVIAGFGEFPIIFTKAVQRAGYEPVVVAIEGESSLELKEVVPNFLTVGVGELEKVLGFFRSQDVSNIVMIGKVHKEKLFSKVEIDDSLKKVIDSVDIKDDSNLLKAIGMAFQKAGLYITDPSKYLSTLLVPKGILTEKEPTELQMADVRYGFSMAKEIARLGIGQTVVVREGTVLAVEAIEGTDKTILRAASLSGGKSVVVKVAAPNHDMRYDIPAVGSDTIDTLHASGASVLAVEAGKTIILDREKVVQQANDMGIVIIAI